MRNYVIEMMNQPLLRRRPVETSSVFILANFHCHFKISPFYRYKNKLVQPQIGLWDGLSTSHIRFMTCNSSIKRSQ